MIGEPSKFTGVVRLRPSTITSDVSSRQTKNLEGLRNSASPPQGGRVSFAPFKCPAKPRLAGWQVDVLDLRDGFPFPSDAQRATALMILFLRLTAGLADVKEADRLLDWAQATIATTVDLTANQKATPEGR